MIHDYPDRLNAFSLDDELPALESPLDSIAVDAESEDGLETVPPVRQASADVKRKVELGRRRLGQAVHGAAVALLSPAPILASIRARSGAASAVTSAARHAKRASKRRPDW